MFVYVFMYVCVGVATSANAGGHHKAEFGQECRVLPTLPGMQVKAFFSVTLRRVSMATLAKRGELGRWRG